MVAHARKARHAGRMAAVISCIAWCAVALAAIADPVVPETIPDGHCDRCGGCERVRTICVRQLTTKEVKKVCWGYRCEQVCIPGPSIFCGTRRHRDDCGCWTCWLWKPTCAEVITRRVPEKNEVTRKVPAVVWTVEERCCGCREAP